MKTKLLSLILVAILVLSALPASASTQTTDAFSGSRAVTLTADTSYLENYVVGGRQMLDLALRKGAPQWLNYQLVVNNRDLSISLSFEFSNMEDYTSKLQMLLMQIPGVLYESGEQVVLLESYSAKDLLKFVETAYDHLETQTEKELQEIFTVTENRIVISGEEYSTQEERIRILPENVVIPQADALTVDTVTAQEGGYERTIQVWCYRQGEEDTRLEQFEEQFASVAEVTKEEDSVLVTFSALNDSELSQKTISCLRCINSITEELAYEDEKDVRATRTEMFDLKEVLAEGANFTYSFTFAPEFRELTTENTEIYLEENKVSATDQQTLTITYLRGFRFSKVESITNLTDPLGRITKILRFYVPAQIAPAYHEQIKAELQDDLCDGIVFNIYDQGSMRCYEFSFGAWYPDQIEDCLKAILGRKDNKFTMERGFFPYAKNVLREELNLEQVIPDALQPESVIRTYWLPDGDERTFEESGKVKITFEGFNFFVCLTYIVVVVLVAILVIFIAKKVINKKQAGQTESSEEAFLPIETEEKSEEEPENVQQEISQAEGPDC